MLERGQGRFPHPCDQLTEGQVAARHIRAQHEGVDEEADEVVQGIVRAARDGGAQRDVVPGAETVQQCGRGGLEQHEHAGAGGARQVTQGQARFGRQLQPDLAAAPGGLGGAGPVQGQVQFLREAAQGLGPVGELGLADLAEQLVLPEGVVGVLDRQRRPLGGAARAPGPVGGREVGQERAVGPLVGGDVVEDDGHDMVGRSDPQHLAAQREFAGEVEGAALGRLDPVGQLPLPAVRHGELGVGLGRRDDQLVWLPVLLGEQGPQRLMASRHIPYGRPECVEVQVPAEAEDQGEVVGDAAAGDPFDQPQAALCRRERDALGPGGGGDGRSGRA